MWDPTHVVERILDHYSARPNPHLAQMKVKLIRNELTCAQGDQARRQSCRRSGGKPCKLAYQRTST